MSEEKKIIIDEDWKSQVEAEKEAVNQPEPEETADEQSTAGDTDPPMPPASMQTLVSSLATEALFALGQIPHPVTGEIEPRKNQAKYLIDTIEVIKEKTEGNIPAEETTAIDSMLHQLRMAFVQMPKS